MALGIKKGFGFGVMYISLLGGEGLGSENVHFGRCRFSSLYAAALGLWWLCDILQMNNCIDISLQYSRWFAAMTIALHGLWHWIGSRHT